MIIVGFITEQFRCIDGQMKDIAKHSQALLWPGEVVTLSAPDYPQVSKLLIFIDCPKLGV